MKENEKNEGLQSRREFFKNAAKGALPILAFTSLGLTILSSCKKDGDDIGCRDCSGSCSTGCTGTCRNSCSGTCDDDCYVDACKWRAW